jgi:hypothetical protein
LVKFFVGHFDSLFLCVIISQAVNDWQGVLNPMSEVVAVTDLPTRWPDILAGLDAGEQEFLVTDGSEIKAVILDQARYRRLVGLATREEKRQRALALPLPAADSSETWDKGFEALDRVSAKFTGLADDELDALFNSVLSEVRDARQE